MWNLSIGIKGPWKDFHQDKDSTRLRKSTLAAGWRMNENGESGTSLVRQWLGVCLPMQGTWVRALVREDPTCRGAAGPVRHNY